MPYFFLYFFLYSILCWFFMLCYVMLCYISTRAVFVIASSVLNQRVSKKAKNWVELLLLLLLLLLFCIHQQLYILIKILKWIETN
jgi:hypothetical protein